MKRAKNIFIVFISLVGLFAVPGINNAEEKLSELILKPELWVAQKSRNPLMKERLRETPVLNGLKQKIGTRAYINISQKVFDSVTLEDIAEFYKSFQGKGYNWVTIACSGGTGLVFAGIGGTASYGTLDNLGRVSQPSWTIMYDESAGTFKRL